MTASRRADPARVEAQQAPPCQIDGDAAAKAPATGCPQLAPGRLRQAIVYGRKVFGLGDLLDGVCDGREDPKVKIGLVGRLLLMVGLLRIRSFNALDASLDEDAMHLAVGAWRKIGKKMCSVDAITYTLHRVDLASVRAASVEMIKKAERNKVFREGWYGSHRYVALDGWEPFCSRKRSCSACLTRTVRVGDEEVTEYYHRYVVALLGGPDVEVVLDMEQVRSADVRAEAGEVKVPGHEGELTAGKRLVRRLRPTYGRWLDVLLVDALYANGPFFTLADQCGFGVIAVLKKENNEPLKEALDLWKDKPAEDIDEPKKGERVELWDCPGIQTLSSYKGEIRVVRGVVHKERNEKPETWCFATTGNLTKRMAASRLVRAGRGRWHIENTAFNQWTQHWHFRHVFAHGATATPALFWYLVLAFNLMQLFVYRQLGNYGRVCGKDPTRTIVRLVDEMRDDRARLNEPLWDTS